MDIETLLRHIQAYSGILSSLCDPCIFITLPYWVLAYFEPEAYLKPCEMLTGHIQNLSIWHYSAIFRHIQNLVQCLHTQKPGILEILEYSGTFYNCIPTYSEPCHIYENFPIFKTLAHLKPNTYSESSQRSKVEFFAKTAKTIIIFPEPSIWFTSFDQVLNTPISQ